MESFFLHQVVSALRNPGGPTSVRVLRFEFPYMRRGRHEGRRRMPDGELELRRSWNEVFDSVVRRHGPPLAIGGKSLGGRMASLVATDLGVQALVCLGYPFHPPGKPTQLRTVHLETIGTPTLICQGERDPFGRRDEVEGYTLSPAVRLCWVGDGDHDFRPRRRSGRNQVQNIAVAAKAVNEFLAGIATPTTL
jgi:predicted alpha/beta-hydrolase family hydrolase